VKLEDPAVAAVASMAAARPSAEPAPQIPSADRFRILKKPLAGEPTVELGVTGNSWQRR
jgi:hypothetical protein